MSQPVSQSAQLHSLLVPHASRHGPVLLHVVNVDARWGSSCHSHSRSLT